MIKMQYQQFMNLGFTEAMKKLTAATFRPTVAYQIHKIANEMQGCRKTIQTEYEALINEFAKKDESGAVIHPDKDDINSFDIDDARAEEFKKTQEAFGLKEIEIDRTPIHHMDLGDLLLSPSEVRALSQVIQFENTPPSGVPGNVQPLHA